MKRFEDRDLLPEFPRTRHLPWQPNATRDDLIASEEEVRCIFARPPEWSREIEFKLEYHDGRTYEHPVVPWHVSFTEKVDGANVGMARTPAGPVIRNRNHLLHKAFAARTPAKAQFAPLWNWYYENADKFERLEESLGHPCSVFGEWLLARHSVNYDRLLDYFVAFDVYDPERRIFIDPFESNKALKSSGFVTAPTITWTGDQPSPAQDPEKLIKYLERQSEFSSTERIEGVYVKVGNGSQVTHRFKMVRPDFIAGEHWSESRLVKNRLRRA
jgi:RNA ligase